MAKFSTLHPLVALLSIVVFGPMAVGCGDSSVAESSIGESKVLSAKEAKQLLLLLPYHYKFRPVSTPEGADAAVAGRAVGRYRTVLNFGIALGHGDRGVPVPLAGTIYPYGVPRSGFIFTSDEFVKGKGKRRMEHNPKLRTKRQWNEVVEMSVNMTDELCLAATGEHCPP